VGGRLTFLEAAAVSLSVHATRLDLVRVTSLLDASY
jgi:hypothetical protein